MEEDSSVPRHDQLRETINAVIFAQQTALEILTNICCDDETWEDNASDSGESDMIEEESEEDGIVPKEPNVDEVNTPICKMPPIALEAVQAHQLLSKVVNKAVMPAENVQELLNAPNAGMNTYQYATTLFDCCICIKVTRLKHFLKYSNLTKEISNLALLDHVNKKN